MCSVLVSGLRPSTAYKLIVYAENGVTLQSGTTSASNISVVTDVAGTLCISHLSLASSRFDKRFIQIVIASVQDLRIVIDTARTVCGAGSMKRSGVRPSVCLSRHSPAAFAAEQEISVDSGGRRRAHSSSGAAARRRRTAANCTRQLMRALSC